MSHHIEGRHVTSLALRKQIPRLRFEDSFGVSEAEKAAVATKLRNGKGKAVRAPVARRSKLSQHNGGSGESDESHSDERHTQMITQGCRRLAARALKGRSKRLRSKILGGSCLQASYFHRRRQLIIDC